ncbi:MAG: HupE/UreJ family protein [Burkholderiaceae bacterium]
MDLPAGSRRIAAWLAVLLLTAVAFEAAAHQSGESLLTLVLEDEVLNVQVDTLSRAPAVPAGTSATHAADDGANGQATHDDAAAIAAQVQGALQIDIADQSCERSTPHVKRRITDGQAHWLIRWQIRCELPVAGIRLSSRLYETDVPAHRLIGHFVHGPKSRPLVLTSADPAMLVTISRPAASDHLLRFVLEGMRHIAIGLDHILFVLTLLLTVVLTREHGHWRPAADGRSVLIASLKLVTAFTVAHSITLTLAGLHLFEPPGRLVESAIALSVLLVALNNIRPVFARPAWPVVFGFGLIHGFGFASVLADLKLPDSSLMLALASFNVGIEFGQLVIVVLTLPLLTWLRQSDSYARIVMPASSAAIAVAAAGWLIERIV